MRRMTSTRLVAALTVLATTAAFAAEPASRNLAVEQSLKDHRDARTAGNVVVAAGAAGLVVAALSTAVGVGIEAENAAKAVGSIATAPYAVAVGLKPAQPTFEDSTPAFMTALVSGLVGAAVLTTGLVVREVAAPRNEKRELLEERRAAAVAQQREELEAIQRSKAVLSAPSLLPVEEKVEPVPAPAPMRKPLRPVDAPVTQP